MPEFLAINPNGRIPGLVDDNFGGEKGHAVFESASIILWLIEVRCRCLERKGGCGTICTDEGFCVEL